MKRQMTRDLLLRWGARFLIAVACLSFAFSAHAKLSGKDIARLEAELKSRGATFSVGENPATRRNLDELCGLVPPPDWRKKGHFVEITTKLALPTYWNWCEQGACPSVRDQGGCGSCWAFATVGVLEANILIEDGAREDISEQYLVSCNIDDWGCSGGWWAHDYHEWKYSHPETEAGAVPEGEFPYTANEAPCGGPYSHPWKISSWAYVGDFGSIPSVEAIKQAILDYGPVAVAIFIGPAFRAYTGGIFNQNEVGTVNHGVLLVGWDDCRGTNGTWFLRNSWGTGWGESGYMWIEYGTSQVGYAASFVEYAGQTPSFNLSSETHGPFSVCTPGLFQIDMRVNQIQGFTDPVTLSVSSLPPDFTAYFDTNPVTPPGGSVLTLTVGGSAPTGTYTIDVLGEGGGQTDVFSFTLNTANGVPDPPALLTPADGETNAGYRNIRFSWYEAAGAAGYHLQVDDDADFSSPEADAPSIVSPFHELAGPLTQGRTYYWRVSPENACGEGPYSCVFSFVANAKEVLLVDDDDNDPDVRERYETALTNLGRSFEVWDTGISDNEPSVQDLSPHKIVIWFTGHSFGGSTGPGAAGEAALADYLQGGGKLFLTSQDYHYARGLTPFMVTYLGLEECQDDAGNYSSISGQNDFTGLGPYSLEFPFLNYADTVIPGSGSISFVEGEGNGAGLYRYNTVFFAFPWEAVACNLSAGLQAAAGDEVLEAVLSYLDPWGMCKCDLNHDRACNMLDWPLFIEDWGRTDCHEPGVECECDLNDDGSCNIQDWSLFIEDWGRSDCPVE